MNPKLANGDLTNLLAEMTVEEKIDLLTGHRMWRTHGVPRLDIPALVMTDGTYGVRYSIPQIDEDEEAGQDFAAFLSVVNQKANDIQIAWGKIKPATCFPNGSTLGCSWDVDLAKLMGNALGIECRSMGVNILLGPGINLRRTPLGGRSYEYFSEDPVVSGDIAAGVINGLQGQGVGASLKHFACNNCEIERTTMNSVVDERALREIYLYGFERAIEKSNPWTVMSSYNRLNGVQAAESEWLLNQVLRKDWDYDGLVMSDWHGIKDRPKSLAAGNDLDMPESSTRRAELEEAISNGTVSMATVDTACLRVLQLVRRCVSGTQVPTDAFNQEAHHRLARDIAAQSIVLLKNDNQVLPLNPALDGRIAVIGPGALSATIQGNGCATTFPTREDVPLEELRAIAGHTCQIEHHVGIDEDPARSKVLLAEAIAAAKDADYAIVFVNTDVGWDGEGSDRTSLSLAPGHDALVEAIAQANPRTIVVLANPDAVAMPWLDQVPAVLETFLAGQAMGGAVADIIFGKRNPSGKLTTTFPKSIRDIPGYLTYPGENGDHVYSESLYVGYRWYDSKEVDVLFPFGHGLSYTRFEYSDLALDLHHLRDGQRVRLSFNLTNVGSVEGQEVCQIYVRYTKPRLHRPVHELKAFSKVALAAGQTQRVEIELDARELRYYDPKRGEWIFDDDLLVIEVGASSRDIRLTKELKCDSNVARYREIRWDTQPGIILETPVAKSAFSNFLQEKLSISEADANRILEHCRNSFFGILTTLDRRLRQRFSPKEVQGLLDEINSKIRADELR